MSDYNMNFDGPNSPAMRDSQGATDTTETLRAEVESLKRERDDYKLRWEQSEACSAVIVKLRGELAEARRERDSLKERGDVEIAVAQAVEFAEYVTEHAKGKMVERARHFLSLPYSQELSARLRQGPP